MKYKIQQNSPFFGYIDAKYSEDGGKTYKCALFDTYEDALFGLAKLLFELNDLEGIDNYRVVKENVKADHDLNADNAKKGLEVLEKIKHKTKQSKLMSAYQNN